MHINVLLHGRQCHKTPVSLVTKCHDKTVIRVIIMRQCVLCVCPSPSATYLTLTHRLTSKARGNPVQWSSFMRRDISSRYSSQTTQYLHTHLYMRLSIVFIAVFGLYFIHIPHLHTTCYHVWRQLQLVVKFTEEQYTTINQSRAGHFDPRVFVNCLQVQLACSNDSFH